MRRSPRPGSAASSQNPTPNLYFENSNSSHSTTSGDSNERRSGGPELGEPEGRRARGSSCGEPALSPGVPGRDTWAGSSRPTLAPRSHNGQTACGAATVRGGASGAGGVEPGGERAGRDCGAGPGADRGAEPTWRLRGRAQHAPLRGELGAMAGPGRGRRKSCAWTWLRRCRRAGLSGCVDPGPAALGLRLGRFLLTETLLLRVWGVRRECDRGAAGPKAYLRGCPAVWH